MTITLTRLDPHIPDPIESRRRAAGRAVRAAYATIVFGILAFFVVYFGRPILYLGGPGSGVLTKIFGFNALHRADQQHHRA
jgi:hypothetical protein